MVISIKFKGISSFVSIIFISYFSITFAQRSTGMSETDSVYLGQYHAIRHTDYDSINYTYSQTITIYRDATAILMVYAPMLGLNDFCFSYQESLKNCFICDLNKDGFPEIGFLLLSPNEFDGDSNKFALYTLYHDKAQQDNEFVIDRSEVYFQNQNNDSIPEMFSFDAYYDPPLPLIWQWDKDKYRIANFKYPDYLLLGISNDFIQSKAPISPDTLSGIITYCFYSGNFAKADSILNNHWPHDRPGKNEFYRNLIIKIHSDPFWPQVQESNW